MFDRLLAQFALTSVRSVQPTLAPLLQGLAPTATLRNSPDAPGSGAHRSSRETAPASEAPTPVGAFCQRFLKIKRSCFLRSVKIIHVYGRV